jgi:glucarate dehydratase
MLSNFIRAISLTTELGNRPDAWPAGNVGLWAHAPGERSQHMKITEIRHWMVYVPFTTGILSGSGRRGGVTRLVVELTTDQGLKGYGETICLLDFIEPVLRRIVVPQAIGLGIGDVELLHRRVMGAGYYHHKRAAVMALCAVEMAMWDALGRHSGQPLHALWGGAYRKSVEVAAFIFTSEPDVLRARALDYFDRGFRTFKVKLGIDAESDIRTVACVREALGAEAQIRADVNGAWTIGTARRQLERLRPFDLSYIEQPLELDDLAGHAELRRSQPIPVALDESAYTLADVGNVVRGGAADVILLDPHEAGGLWQCIKAAGVAEAVGIPVTLHAGGELALSQAAYLHLAASIPNMTIPIDSEYSYQTADIVAERLVTDGGRMPVPEGPGLGVTPDLDLLERYRVGEVHLAYLDAQRPGWFPVKPSY